MKWKAEEPEAPLASGTQPRPDWTGVGLPDNVMTVSCANWWRCGMKTMATARAVFFPPDAWPNSNKGGG